MSSYGKVTRHTVGSARLSTWKQSRFTSRSKCFWTSPRQLFGSVLSLETSFSFLPRLTLPSSGRSKEVWRYTFSISLSGPSVSFDLSLYVPFRESRSVRVTRSSPRILGSITFDPAEIGSVLCPRSSVFGRSQSSSWTRSGWLSLSEAISRDARSGGWYRSGRSCWRRYDARNSAASSETWQTFGRKSVQRLLSGLTSLVLTTVASSWNPSLSAWWRLSVLQIYKHGCLNSTQTGSLEFYRQGHLNSTQTGPLEFYTDRVPWILHKQR